MQAWQQGQWERCLLNGDSFHDVERRFVPFIDALQRGGNPNASVLLVGHGGLFQCMLARVLANVDSAFSFRTVLGHTSWVLAETHGGTLVCRQWEHRLVADGERLSV